MRVRFDTHRCLKFDVENANDILSNLFQKFVVNHEKFDK